jgi:hypothetical protein
MLTACKYSFDITKISFWLVSCYLNTYIQYVHGKSTASIHIIIKCALKKFKAMYQFTQTFKADIFTHYRPAILNQGSIRDSGDIYIYTHCVFTFTLAFILVTITKAIHFPYLESTTYIKK